jgi:hypothetical protein
LPTSGTRGKTLACNYTTESTISTEEEFNRSPAPGGTGFFADCAEIAKDMDSSTTGFLRVHAGGEVFSDLMVEMEAQLGV